MADKFADVEQAKLHVRRADVVWIAAVEGFDSYPERLRRLADAAAQQRRAALVAELADVPWNPLKADPKFSLALHLEPGHRPGPDSAWKDFDKAHKQFGKALAGSGYTELAAAFDALAKAITAVADTLDADSSSTSGQRHAA